MKLLRNVMCVFTKRRFIRFHYVLSLFTFLLLLFIVPQYISAQIIPNTNRAASQTSKEPRYAKDRIIVKFKNASTISLLTTSTTSTTTPVFKKSNLRKGRALFKNIKDKAANAKLKRTKFKKGEPTLNQKMIDKSAEELSKFAVIDLPANSDVEKTIQDLKTDPSVEYVQPDYIMEANSTPNDPYFNSAGSWGQTYDDLWALKRINAPAAWDKTQGEGILVAVVDSGVDYLHPDIQQNIWNNPDEIPNNGIDDDANGFIDDTIGWNFHNQNNNPYDGDGHGTHVAGIIAAQGDNGIGIIGVAPKAKILPVKGLDNNGSGYSSSLANGLIYAAMNGADVINNSWGCSSGCPHDPVIEEAVRTAYGLGSVVVFAAGNASANTANFSPQNMTDPKPLVVSALNVSNLAAGFSNTGFPIDVAAPGGEYSNNCLTTSGALAQNILSLRAQGTDMYGSSCGSGAMVVGTNYYRSRGTSMAAPFVTGVAALVKARHPQWTNIQIASAIRSSADDLSTTGFDLLTGYGKVNAINAVDKNTSFAAEINAININEPSIEIVGTAMADVFSRYELAWAQTDGISIPTNFSSTNITLTNAGLQPVQHGTLGTLQTNLFPDGRYILRLKLFYDNVRIFTFYSPVLYIDHRIHPGWPVQTGGEIVSSPIITDLDRDGRKELVIGSSDSKIYVLDADGRNKPGWPVQLPVGFGSGVVGYSSPAVADLDGNGKLDIVVRRDKFLYVFRSDGTALPGWPVQFGAAFDGNIMFSSPVIADINHDDRLDIIVTGGDPTQGGGIYIFQNNGTPLPGWPKFLGDDFFGTLSSTPAVIDLNQDGILDIISQYVKNGQPGKVFALQGNGEFMSGWPKILERSNASSPIAADLDGDGVPEIIAGTYEEPNNNAKIYVWHPDGSLLTGWPKTVSDNWTIPQGFAIVDIDGDSQPEILVAVSHQFSSREVALYAFKINGQLLWKGSQEITERNPISDSSVIVANIANFGLTPIVATGGLRAGDSGEIVVFTPQGQKYIPLTRYIPDAIRATPAVGDLDNDGLLEIAVGTTQGRIFVWDMDGAANTSSMPWPIFQNNAQRNGTPQAAKSIAPVLMPIGNQSVDEGQTINITTNAWDLNIDDPLVFSSGQLPTGTSFNPQTRTFSWTPDWTEAGNYPLTFTVSDGSLVDSETLQIHVNNVNLAPFFSNLPNQSVNENQSLSFSVSATDPDGGTLTYSATSLPSGAAFDSTTKTFSWTPSFTQAGIYTVTFNVSDGQTSVAKNVQITVTNVNRAPIANAGVDQTMNAGTSVNLNGSASSDPDGDPLTYSWNFGDGTALASGVSVSHAYLTIGNYTVTLTVSDGNLTGSDTALVTVTGANIVLNPNFESAKTFWTGWGTPVKLVTASPFEGTSSVEMTLAAGGVRNLSQIVSPVTAGQKYQAKAALKTAAVTSQSYVQLEWRKSGGTLIRTDTFGQTTGTNAWAVKTSPVFTAPTGAAKVTVKLISDKGTGKAYFDAVEFRQVP